MSDVRVLVVDDHESYRRAVAAVVDETDGFVVVAVAESGEESLTLSAALRPDLILMDVNMPGIDGIEATRRLHAAPGAPIVVLLSTYDEGEIDYRDCGAAGYISKSTFGADRLAGVWSSATGRSTATG